MSDETARFRTTPNRLQAEGATDMDSVAMSMLIDEEGVHLTVRRGSFDKERIDLTYDSVDAVDYRDDLTYSLVVKADGTVYTVTNVTADPREIESIVEYVQNAVDRRRNRVVDGGATRAGGGGSGSGTTADTDTDAEGGGGPTGGGADGTGATGGSPPGSDTGGDVTERLREWADLRDQGIITDEEFEAKKRELLGN
jgi:hypothetical protein